jgi:phenylalanyl-tRNA synthetase alpha subunit
MGLDRLAMALFGLPDIRLLIENDQRFLAQFAR